VHRTEGVLGTRVREDTHGAIFSLWNRVIIQTDYSMLPHRVADIRIVSGNDRGCSGHLSPESSGCCVAMVLNDSAAFGLDISHWWPIAISTKVGDQQSLLPLSI
jgi:hypothetical protein